VDSAIFLFTRRVLVFFRVNPAKSFNQPDFFIRSACFDPSAGQTRENPGKQEGGGAKKKTKIGEFSFRGILQPTTGVVALETNVLETGVVAFDSRRHVCVREMAC